MTRSFGGGPDRPPRNKQPELRQTESEYDIDNGLDSQLQSYEPNEEAKVESVPIDFAKRLVAAIIDLGVAYAFSSIITLIPFLGSEATSRLILVVALLTRDWFFGGRGIGKNLMGLQVVDLQSGRPCSLMQAVKRNIVLLGPLLVLVVVAVVLQIVESFSPLPGNIHSGIYQAIYTLGTLYTIAIVPYETYRVYSRSDARRLGDSFAGTAVVEAPMDFSTPVPRKP